MAALNVFLSFLVMLGSKLLEILIAEKNILKKRTVWAGFI